MTQSPYSHYSPYRTKEALRPLDANVHLVNLSGNNAINYGVSGAVPGVIGGLGGAGIGALIQAIRGKSIGKGALIGGGTGALAGAGTGLLAKYVTDAYDPAGAENIRTARQFLFTTDPVEKEKLQLRMKELALLMR